MDKSDLLKAVLVNEELTLTAIAKKMGMTKATEGLKNLMQELVNGGSVIENTQGRYVTYKKASAVSRPAQGTTTETVVGTPSTSPAQLPAAPDSKVSGYSVKKLNEKGKDKVRITLPNGKTIKINPDDNLLVINDEPKYVVKTPQDVVACIKQYSVDKGMRTFTVDDITQNKKIGTEDDVQIPDNHIIFMSIQKHNKAA